MRITQALQLTYESVRRAGYVLGGMIVAMLVLSMSSGVVISLFYLPFPGLAYESVAQMVGNPLVSYARNIHFWSSDILFVLVILHLTRVVLSKVTGKFKRVAYWIGLLMALLLANEMLFGTFLRSDQEAYEAYAHFIVGGKGLMPPFVRPLIDFFGTGQTALLRFFVTHALLIPGALIFLVFLHSVYAASFRGLVKQTSMGLKQFGPSGPAAGEAKKPSLWQFPQLRILAKSILVLVGLTLVLSYFIPAPFLSRPYGGLEITKPPWYLLWIYGLENMFGLWPIVAAPLAVAFIFAIVPFFSRDDKRLDWALVIYFTTMSIIVALGFYAAFGQEISHLEHFEGGGQEHTEGHE